MTSINNFYSSDDKKDGYLLANIIGNVIACTIMRRIHFPFISIQQLFLSAAKISFEYYTEIKNRLFNTQNVYRYAGHITDNFF